MQPEGIDLYLFISLLVILIYVLAVNTITTLHKAYIAFHSLMMLWPGCNFLINITHGQPIQWFLLNVAFVGLCFLGFGWLIFALLLTREIDSFEKKVLSLWAIPAVLCSMLVTTNPWHFLFVQPSGEGWAIRTYGPFFWLFVLSSIVYLIVATAFMLRTLTAVPESNMKKQLSLCVWGVILLLMFSLSDVLFNVVFFPRFGVVAGLTSYGIITSVICFVIAIQKYDLFRIVTIAQREIIDSMTTGMIVIDNNDLTLDLNRSANKFLKIRPGQVFDMRKLFTLSPKEGLTAMFLEEYSSNKSKILQTEIMFGGEKTGHFSITVSPVFDRRKCLLGRIITFNDITELSVMIQKINEKNITLKQQNKKLLRVQEELYRANKRLEQMTITDALTGCYNKRYLLQQLVHEVAVARRFKFPFSIILFDLDNFKLINDTYGHLAGDNVLRGVVDVIKQNLRGADMLARFGGEEFIIYMPHTDRDGAAIFAERIRFMVENHCIRTSGADLSVTISAGLISVNAEAEFVDDHHIFLENLLTRVDSALYESKSRGRNCVVVADASVKDV
jgi:two-component system cell cycle response regulator